ncbi:hypothetical protein [Desulfurispira natronophila]|uniref:Uncharacterized protein n=1 Tax=Desulfurispira natronophila TaxID=682562 RepID=A0A7W7Y5G9_9BACT|nr:hypothetical protein [Desulfurispira natronophila]MBB5022446.1 hypothetical protein [Desulfurispira natronophila]
MFECLRRTAAIDMQPKQERPLLARRRLLLAIFFVTLTLGLSMTAPVLEWRSYMQHSHLLSTTQAELNSIKKMAVPRKSSTSSGQQSNTSHTQGHKVLQEWAKRFQDHHPPLLVLEALQGGDQGLSLEYLQYQAGATITIEISAPTLDMLRAYTQQLHQAERISSLHVTSTDQAPPRMVIEVQLQPVEVARAVAD